MKKTKVLFIDRDGTIVKEAKAPDYQLDTLEELEFYPEVFRYLGKIARKLSFELVMVTNQDGLGTEKFPENVFWPLHHHIIKSFENEGIKFSKIFIDKTFPHENANTRKPNTGMLTEYITNSKYDLKNSFVIGDRLTDVELAKNLGSRAIFIANDEELGAVEIKSKLEDLQKIIALKTTSWKQIYTYLKK